MAEALRTWAPVVLATVLACPVAAVVVAGVATHRIRGGEGVGRAWTTAGADVGMVVGTLPWVWMILTPRAGAGGVEMLPGRGLADILGGDYSTAVVQVGGNLLVGASFGFLAPLRWPLRLGTVAGCAAAGSTTVEALQYVLELGRVSSADDVALNTLGAVLAAILSRPWWRRRRPDGGKGGLVPSG